MISIHFNFCRNGKQYHILGHFEKGKNSINFETQKLTALKSFYNSNVSKNKFSQAQAV